MGFHTVRVRVPAFVRTRAKQTDPKVAVRVREYLGRFSDGMPGDIVERVAKDVMLDRFGYGSCEGKRLAAQVIARVQAEVEAEKAKPIPVAIPRTPAVQVREIKPRTRRRRLINRRRKSDKIGEHNEERFHELMVGLTRILIQSQPDIISAVASRSERHDPLGGVTDFRDHDGEDVSLGVAVNGGGQKLFIYDVKSSSKKASAFNRSVRLIGQRQKKASLKRAIVVNIKRHDSQIIGEVLDDLVLAGVMTPDDRLIVLDQAIQ